MSDFLSKKERSIRMSKIRSKDTKPELLMRRFLFSLGLRFRLYDKKLPGRPDIVLKRHRTAIQVQGCFWHNHGCKYSNTPRSNKLFWREKLKKNILRDKRNQRKIKNLGWRLLNVWECQIMIKKDFDRVKKRIIKHFNENKTSIH